MMNLSQLNGIVRGLEADLAPGSETSLLGEYNERMRQVTGGAGVMAREPENMVVPWADAAWWLGAYAAEVLAADTDDIHGSVGDWDAEAFAEDKARLVELFVTELWPLYKDGFDYHLQALRDATD